MSIKPILFNTEMVRAILDGRKTVTRRLPSKRVEEKWWEYDEWVSDQIAGLAREGIPSTRTYEKEFYEQYPPYQPGDILYVRETWLKDNDKYYYRADFDSDYLDPCETLSGGYPAYCRYHSDCYGCTAVPTRLLWHPSIHMPKEAARIWLKVTDVRVERLQKVTEEQATKEGAIDNRGFIHSPDNEYDEIHTAREHFEKIWDSTIQKQDLYTYGWDANPWVWVIEFERCEKPED